MLNRPEKTRKARNRVVRRSVVMLKNCAPSYILQTLFGAQQLFVEGRLVGKYYHEKLPIKYQIGPLRD